MVRRIDRASRTEPEGPEPEQGPLVLEAVSSPWKRVLGLAAFAVVWSGGTGFVCVLWWNDFRAGSVDGCSTLFLVPFVLVGLFALWALPAHVAALRDPKPSLTLEHRRLEPGTETTVSWTFRGRGWIRRLKLILEGAEVATVTRGTTSTTYAEAFHRTLLVDTDAEAERGTARLTVPRDTMHSFRAPNNQIRWQLHLHATVEGRQSVDESFSLTVHPLRVDG